MPYYSSSKLIQQIMNNFIRTFSALLCGIGFFLWSLGLLASETVAKQSAFFEYLLQAKPRPAMIAYNPSNLNPDDLRLPKNQLAERIQSDLMCLRQGFDGLVLYRYNPDFTPIVISQAVSLGFRGILLGIWDVKSNEELTGTVNLIKQYSHTLAFAVVVGNEGLNDNRYTLTDITVAQAKLANTGLTEMKIPMATSEPMSRYGSVDLRLFGDFLAPNIHPAIDRRDLGPSDAAAWVHGRARALAQIAKKPVLVKETGLPNGGESGNTPERQYEFWHVWYDKGAVLQSPDRPNAWISLAAVFEAFDSPWKATKSGNHVEGHWGILTEQLQPYPAFGVFAANQSHCGPVLPKASK